MHHPSADLCMSGFQLTVLRASPLVGAQILFYVSNCVIFGVFPEIRLMKWKKMVFWGQTAGRTASKDRINTFFFFPQIFFVVSTQHRFIP